MRPALKQPLACPAPSANSALGTHGLYFAPECDKLIIYG